MALLVQCGSEVAEAPPGAREQSRWNAGIGRGRV